MYRVGIRKDGNADILIPNYHINKKEYEFLTTGFKNIESAKAYLVNLGYPTPNIPSIKKYSEKRTKEALKDILGNRF